jgi:fumarate hydratase subunit beta
MKKLNTPLDRNKISSLKAGELLHINGTIFTARDQAHKRLFDSAISKKRIPLDLKNQTIYYCGPTKAKRGMSIGSCGPTTSSRMDRYTPLLLSKGVSALIGKGDRSDDVYRALKRYNAVYFLAPGGAGAYLAGKVTECELVAYRDLGPEAIYKLTVRNFPVIVAIDVKGRSIFK